MVWGDPDRLVPRNASQFKMRSFVGKYKQEKATYSDHDSKYRGLDICRQFKRRHPSVRKWSAHDSCKVWRDWRELLHLPWLLRCARKMRAENGNTRPRLQASKPTWLRQRSSLKKMSECTRERVNAGGSDAKPDQGPKLRQSKQFQASWRARQAVRTEETRAAGAKWMLITERHPLYRGTC